MEEKILKQILEELKKLNKHLDNIEAEKTAKEMFEEMGQEFYKEKIEKLKNSYKLRIKKLQNKAIKNFRKAQIKIWKTK